MSLKPIDLQITFNTSAEISKINAHNSDKSGTFAKHFQQKLEERINEEKEVIVEIRSLNEMSVDKDGQKKEQQQQKKQSKKMIKSSKKKMSSSSMFDLSI